jgi:hypothetical protein
MSRNCQVDSHKRALSASVSPTLLDPESRGIHDFHSAESANTKSDNSLLSTFIPASPCGLADHSRTVPSALHFHQHALKTKTRQLDDGQLRNIKLELRKVATRRQSLFYFLRPSHSKTPLSPLDAETSGSLK